MGSREPYRRWLRSLLPDDARLAAGLSRLLEGDTPNGGVTLVERIPNVYASSFPSEIVRCRAHGEEHTLLCKYSAGQSYESHGHRGGVAYEGDVYTDVLAPLDTTVPPLYGIHRHGSDDTWLVVGFVTGARRADESEPPGEALRAAAAWAGRFHARNEPRVAAGDVGVVNRYDAAYYRSWAERLASFAGDWHDRLPWLRTVCDRVADVVVPELLALAPTVIHGEFTPHNVLVRDGVAHPVDWESTAIAPGEIDLVSLTQKWPDDVVRDCEAAYRAARWPAGAPADLDRRLDLARVYWDLRWLGDRPEWLAQEKVRTRFAHLRDTAARLGLLPAADVR